MSTEYSGGALELDIPIVLVVITILFLIKKLCYLEKAQEVF